MIPPINFQWTGLTSIPKNFSIWYVGTEIALEEGIRRFLNYLSTSGHILVGTPVIYDYIYIDGNILYVIYYKSLPKLEYLEYMWKKRVGKHGKKTL